MQSYFPPLHVLLRQLVLREPAMAAARSQPVTGWWKLRIPAVTMVMRGKTPTKGPAKVCTKAPTGVRGGMVLKEKYNYCNFAA